MAHKTIYMSGKITGDPVYMSHFAKAEDDIRERIFYGDLDEYTSILNPAKVNFNLPKDFEHKDYMTVCIAMLNCCHAIYMLDNWQDSVGAQIEYEYAQQRGLAIYYEKLSD